MTDTQQTTDSTLHSNMHNTATKKTVVWIISDGIAGHYNQSKGVLQSLKLIDPLIDAYWIELRLRAGALRLILSTLLNLFGTRLSLKYLGWFYENVDLPFVKPDIVVGTGGKVSFAVVWLAGFYGAKSIFCGSRRRLKTAHFSAILTVEPETAPQYIVLEAYPTHITPPQKIAQHRTTPLWACLIGGDRNGITYTDNDWNMLANQLNQLSQSMNVHWLITSSRRTGFEAEQILNALIAPQYIEDLAWASQDNRPVIQDYLNRASFIVCTADSHSMLTESIVARHKIVAVHPNAFEPDEEYIGMLKRYDAAGRIKLLNIRELANFLQTPDALDQLHPIEQDLSMILAQKLAAHLQLTSTTLTNKNE